MHVDLNSYSQQCNGCLKEFSITIGKFHCNICHKIFCQGCLKRKIERSYQGIKREMNVCEYCYKESKKMDISIENNKENFDRESFFRSKNNFERQSHLRDYCKNAERENEDNYNFLKLKEKKKEDYIKKEIEAYYSRIVNGYIQNVLSSEKKYPHLQAKWSNKIYEYVMQIVSKLSPSFKDLKDPLNINEFVKVKTIAYKDQSLCQLIDGYAMRKNVSSKKMTLSLDNPRILLLNCGLDSINSNDKETWKNLEQLKSQMREYTKIQKKIESVKANLILINQNVSIYLQQDFIEKNHIVLVLGVKEKSLRCLSRCTKTIVLNSITDLDSEINLGTCKSFKVKKIKRQSKSVIKSNDYNLMIFEGCNELLFQTIILSDPKVDELAVIKQLIKSKILLTVRDFYLQKTLLYYMYCDFPMSPTNSPKANNIMFLSIGKCIQFGKFDIKKKTDKKDDSIGSQDGINSDGDSSWSIKSDTSEDLLISDGFDSQEIVSEETSFSLVKVTMVRNVKNPTALGVGVVSESELQRKINVICELPEKLELKFYSSIEKYDKPLGRFLLEICYEKNKKCDRCKRPQLNHFYYLYSPNSGRIKISFLTNNKEYKIDKVLEYINREAITDFYIFNTFTTANLWGHLDYTIDIFSFGFCKKCKEIVTPLCKLPRELFNFSSAKFFKHMLFNHDIQNRNDKTSFNISEYFAKNDCNHKSFKYIDRIFVTKIGVLILSLEKYQKYYLNQNILTRLELKAKIPQFDNLIKKEQCVDILDSLVANFVFLKQELIALNSLKEEKKITNNKLKTIIENDSINITEIITILKHQLKKDITEPLFSLKLDAYSKSRQCLRKLYFKICQIKLLYNKIRKRIQRLKNYIALELYMNTEKNIPSKEELLPMHQMHFVQKAFEKYSHLFQNVNYKDIDNNQAYKKILDEIKYYQEKHTNATPNVNVDDIGSLVSYALTSEEYRTHLYKLSKCHLMDIQINRTQMNDTYTTTNKRDNAFPSPLPNFRDLTPKESSKNYDPSFLSQSPYPYLIKPNPNELPFNTPNFFDFNKNQFKGYQTEKMNLLLESDILSGDKSHFTYDIYSINNKMFKSQNPSRKTTMTMTTRKTIQPNSPCEEPIEKILEKLKKLDDELQRVWDEINDRSNEVMDINPLITKKIKINSFKFTEEIMPKTHVEIKVYYPRQFEALRLACKYSFDDIIGSISKSMDWTNVTGGKSKASFFKSVDNKFVFKNINQKEFTMFKETASEYFFHTEKSLFHKMPSVLAKILGVFTIKRINTIKNKKTEIQKYYLILMENLFCGNSSDPMIKAYDLKGSLINRYISPKDKKPNQVLLDTNFKEDFNGEPLVLDRNTYDYLLASLHNDSLFLSKNNVIDYSLLIIITDSGKKDVKLLRLGIIDYVRKYTLDKKMEYVFKKIINGLNAPTIINPIDYKERFKSAMMSYFIGV